jgi:hypothetical protein
MLQRAGIIADRLYYLLEEMTADPIAPPEKIHELRASLADHYHRSEYLACESMGALVRENLESIRLQIGRPALRPSASEERRRAATRTDSDGAQERAIGTAP